MSCKMSKEEIQAMFDGTGIECEEYEFEDDVKELPFMVWYYGDTKRFLADGIVYAQCDEVIVELYSDRQNPELEQRVEAALEAHGLAYQMQREWLQAESMHETIYLTEVYRNE